MAKEPIKTIIFFLAGSSATKEEALAASALGPGVRFCNASKVSAEDKPRKCDAVAGKVPAQYAAVPLAKPVKVSAAPAPAPEAKEEKPTAPEKQQKAPPKAQSEK